MYSYLDVGRGYHPGRINLKKFIKYVNTNTSDPTRPAVKLKLEVFTVPTNAWACLVTCDPGNLLI